MSNVLKAELTTLAGEMVRGVGMPSPYTDDHEWSKTTCLRERRRILREASAAQDQARDWAMRLKKIIDSLPNQNSEGANPLRGEHCEGSK